MTSSSLCLCDGIAQVFRIRMPNSGAVGCVGVRETESHTKQLPAAAVGVLPVCIPSAPSLRTGVTGGERETKFTAAHQPIPAAALRRSTVYYTQSVYILFLFVPLAALSLADLLKLKSDPRPTYDIPPTLYFRTDGFWHC